MKCSPLPLFTLLVPVILCAQSATTPYLRPTPEEVKMAMEKVMAYMELSTPFGIVEATNGKAITDLDNPVRDATLAKSTYGLATHEWGLAYSGMLRATDATGDLRFAEYVRQRFEFLAKAAPYFRKYKRTFPDVSNPLEHFLYPRLLDDTGSMCAAIIQAMQTGIASGLRAEIDSSVNFIMNSVHRLPNGTFARNRPMPNSVWVDDLYQGIPALAHMGALTGEGKYFDEAARQVSLFRDLLFDRDVNVCAHGWIEGVDPSPRFYWARANGWAVLAVASLLDVLPKSHPRHETILEFYQSYCQGLARLQSGSGFWHQLLDRNDSFLETSATAMFTYAFAHGVNQGWLDIKSYGPRAVLGWNAITTKINNNGAVEGTSAGTSIAFDPAFYYQRPVGTGPHGYGSVMHAAAAIYMLLKDHPYDQNGPLIFRE